MVISLCFLTTDAVTATSPSPSLWNSAWWTSTLEPWAKADLPFLKWLLSAVSSQQPHWPSSVVYWYSIGPRPKSGASSHAVRHRAKCVSKSREVGTCVPLGTLRVRDKVQIHYPLFSSWIYDLSLPTHGRKHMIYLACEILHTSSPSVGVGVSFVNVTKDTLRGWTTNSPDQAQMVSWWPLRKTPQRILRTRSWCFGVSWSSSQLSWLPAGRKEGLPQLRNSSF